MNAEVLAIDGDEWTVRTEQMTFAALDYEDWRPNARH